MYGLSHTTEVLKGQILCEPLLASMAVVNCQQLETFVFFNFVILWRNVVILLTHVGFRAEFDRAARALDEEKTLPGLHACGACGPEGIAHSINLYRQL